MVTENKKDTSAQVILCWISVRLNCVCSYMLVVCDDGGCVGERRSEGVTLMVGERRYLW